MKAGDSVLDVGCGSGVFLRAVTDLGARAYGLDASRALLQVARARVPEADLRVGDAEQLPHEDDFFDLVTGFNSFFFADDMVAALREGGACREAGRDRADPGLGATRALRARADAGGGGTSQAPAAGAGRRAAPAAMAAGRARGHRVRGATGAEQSFSLSTASSSGRAARCRGMLSRAG